MGESVTQSTKTQATAPALPLKGSIVVCKRYTLCTLSPKVYGIKPIIYAIKLLGTS